MYKNRNVQQALKCLFPHCDCGRATRGLCRSHYSYASLLVRNGITTWKELEDHGKCLPRKGKSQYERSSWLLDFKKAKP